MIKNICVKLNIFSDCKRYGLSLWQCPPFLFLTMGLVIIISSLATYFIGVRYIEAPEIVAMIVLALALILFIMSFIIMRSFERLAETNRMKSEFINVVSHQLRTPISSLRWVVDILTTDYHKINDSERHEYFDILKENIGRMGELVSDLLIVSRLETATLPFRKEKVFLPSLVEEVLSSFLPFAKASNVEVEFKREDNLPNVFVDPSQVKQVLENLIHNAIRYIKDKGKIKLSLFRKDKNIYFEITDNGVGIPKEDQKYIFQKFFRASNVIRHQTDGSGLGLYIAKSIIDKSGGKIGFHSQENKGSTFWFSLPIT